MRAFISLTLLVFTLLACQGASLPGAASLPSGSVLFQDDFSDPNSGWRRISTDPRGIVDYAEGGYRIQVNAEHLFLWAGPGLRFTDVRVEVDAIKIAGPADDDFGIVCRARDKDNFYFLVISSDGYYGIGKVIDGIPELVGMPAMPPSEDIRPGETANRLRADCVGETLTLFVNGIQLASVQDPEFPSGEVGLLAGAFAHPGAEVHFERFTVIKP